MKKTIFTCLISGFCIASFILSTVAYMKTREMNQTVNFEEHIVSVLETEAIMEEEIMTKKGANLKIDFANNKITMSDSTISLKGDVNVVFDLYGTHLVKYESSHDTIKIDNRMLVGQVSADGVKNNISTFVNKNGTNSIVGQKKINKNTAICVTVEDATEQDLGTVKTILNSLAIYDGSINVSLLNRDINQEWTKKIAMTEKAICLSNGKDSVYLTPYTESIEKAGFNKELKIDSHIKLDYGNLKDKKTGYKPYILKQDEGNIEFLSKDNSHLVDLFK